MAVAKKYSNAEVKEMVNQWVDATKIAQADFDVIVNEIDGLINKIGKIYTLETSYKDKLSMLDGEFLSFGRTIEEWKSDLMLPTAYEDVDEAEDLKSSYPTYRPAAYSEDLGDKVFKVTRSFKELQATVHNDAQLSDLITGIQRELNNSIVTFRYAAKRQLIGRLAQMAIDEKTVSKATTWAAGTARTVNTIVKDTSAGTNIGIVVKPYAAAANLTYANAVAQGYIINLDLVSTIAKPVDTATGEAFVKQLKADVEKASDISEGNSLNGNTLGANEKAYLFVKQGLMPTIEVDVQAGAFNGEKVAMPVEVVVLPDFGKEADDSVFAVLTDSRTIRLYPSFEYGGSANNISKAYMNYIQHFQATGAISRNTFVKVYKNA